MSKVRTILALVVLLPSAACFSPPTPVTDTDDHGASTDGSGTQGEADATETHPSTDDPSTDPSATTSTPDPDGGTDSTATSDTTAGPGCTPGVFGRSQFGDACFQ